MKYLEYIVLDFMIYIIMICFVWFPGSTTRLRQHIVIMVQFNVQNTSNTGREIEMRKMIPLVHYESYAY